jgi:hypothetical protein
MPRSLLLVVLTPVLVIAADPPGLTSAKDVHAKEMAKLRQALLDAFDEEIKREKGNALDFLLAEQKAFRENGVVPILPTMAGPAKRPPTTRASSPRGRRRRGRPCRRSRRTPRTRAGS